MKKGKIVVLLMLMAAAISACGNKTSQTENTDLENSDMVTDDVSGQIGEDSVKADFVDAENGVVDEENDIIDAENDIVNKENDIIEITDYIGSFEKVVEIMDMGYDDEPMMGNHNYCIDDFKLGWDDSGYYVISNQGNEHVTLYGVCVGDNKADVLPKIQEYGYTCQYLSEDSDAIYLLYNGQIIYIEIFYDSEQVTAWYANNYEEGDIEDIKNILELKDQYNVKELEPWKSAYIDFIFENGINYDSLLDGYLEKYKLIDINGDNIPELYINFGSTAGGDMLCSYFDNSVIYQHIWNYGLSYIEGENLFLDSGGHMDAYYDIVYSIENGTFVVWQKGEYGAEDNSNVRFDSEGYPIYNYYWNGNQVSSEAEYEELLNKAFDKGRATNPYESNDVFEYQEIMKQIIEY